MVVATTIAGTPAEKYEMYCALLRTVIILYGERNEFNKWNAIRAFHTCFRFVQTILQYVTVTYSP